MRRTLAPVLPDDGVTFFGIFLTPIFYY